MADLSTTYLGFTLRNPLVVASGPMCEDLGSVRLMEDSGASAVVLHSLFEEQILHESLQIDQDLEHGSESFAEALSYFPDMGTFKMGPEAYLEHIRQVKAAVDIPVIGSLNGVTAGGWIQHAKLIEEAGADALELNIYCVPTDPQRSAAQVEQTYVDVVREVRANLGIPLAVKIGPHFSAPAHLARSLADAGADALVLFNRFYEPDFDLENQEIVPSLTLSSSDELRSRLLWAAILWGEIEVDLAITGGVHTAEDVLKAMMAGARVTLIASALVKSGIGHLTQMRDDLARWMQGHEFESIRQMQGTMSRQKAADADAFERANYMKTLRSLATP